jgi:cytochrome P450
VTRYDDIRTVLGSPAASSDTTRPGFPQSSESLKAMRGRQRAFVRMDPPQHSEHRRMLMRDFAVPHVATFRPYLEARVSELLDDMEQKGPVVDLVTALAQPVPASMICKMLDLPWEDSDFFQDRLDTWMSLETSPEESWEAASDVHKYFDRLVDERAADPGEDLISRLVTEHFNAGHLTREELLHMLHLLVVGGFDTTANMIALGTITLLDHPDQLTAMLDDPALVPGAVEELLRYLSVTHHTAFRLAMDDIEVDGRTIHRGEGLIAPLPAANHDPSRFPAPGEFDIRRDARGHVAFGFGIHQCLGQALARLELQVVFPQLFGRFPSLRIAANRDDLRFTNALIYGVKSLPVAWD